MNVSTTQFSMGIFPLQRMQMFMVLLLVLGLTACELPSQRDAAAPAPEQQSQGVDVAAWPQVANPFGYDADLEQRIDALLAKMSIEEKVGQMMQAEIKSLAPGDIKKYHLGSVLNGGGSWPYRKDHPEISDWLQLADSLYEESMDTSDGRVAIPIMWGTDAVHGHNNVIGATLFPHNIGLGATRNLELVTAIGAATAKAVRATGIEWTFAPTVAVARNDAWGRTYESYSESPELVAQFSAAMVRGLQGDVQGDDFLASDRVIATAKHYLGDGGTWRGDDQGDVRIPQQELIAIHNAGYPPAIKAGVQTVMASFNSWYGQKMHGNQDLLTAVLKERMGFDGFVVGDWNGHAQVKGCSKRSCAQAINAGIDMVMVPDDWRAMLHNTLAQVDSGEIPVSRIEDAVRRILRVKLRAGLFDTKPSERAPAAEVIGSAAHRALARQAVRESLVLLKNDKRVLPISPQQRILVVGKAAQDIAQQSGGWSVTWQGTGNTNARFPGATSIFEGIAAAVAEAGGTLSYSDNGDYATKPDVAIVVFGETPYAEGRGDRDSLEFQPGSKRALKKLQKLQAQGIPVVSLFLSGRPMWVNPELNASDAFVAAWLPGSEGAGIADVIIAKGNGEPRYNFTGRLAFSWPAKPLDMQLNMAESPYQPLFPLGYGLGYDTSSKALGNQLEEAVAGVATGDVSQLDFYVGRAMQPWNLFLISGEQRDMLSGAQATLSDGSMQLTTVDKEVQEDALKLRWHDLQSGKLVFYGDQPLNLAAFAERGTLAFDIQVKDLSKGGMELAMSCGEDCFRKVPIDVTLRNTAKSGWQNITLALQCFVRDNENLAAVQLPFVLEVGGSGEVELANIRFHRGGKPNTECPDYRRVAVTPAKLEKFWALDWWQPRHQQLVERVKQGDVDLIMIGDSITHWWERFAPQVWEEYYGHRNAVNMGFAGDRTENVLWRLQNGEIDNINPKVAVLLIGTNNTGHRLQAAQYTVAGIRKILDTLRNKLPGTKVLLLAIFPREASPQAPMRLINEQINTQIAKFADNKNIYFLNINEQFVDQQGVLSPSVAPDLLHLNEASYRRWAEAMEPLLQQLMGEN